MSHICLTHLDRTAQAYAAAARRKLAKGLLCPDQPVMALNKSLGATQLSLKWCGWKEKSN